MVVLGIDPGIERVGYGILEVESVKRRTVQKVGWGCIETSSRTPHADRLAEIYQQLSRLIKKIKPKIVGVEKLFFFKNAKTALTVSEARGVILLALANERIPIVEFTPLQVKQTVTNYGRADKRQIQAMVKMTLGLSEVPKPDDAADALAIAICALHKLPRN